MCIPYHGIEDIDAWALQVMQDELRQRQRDPDASWRDAHGHPPATPWGAGGLTRRT